jgi:diketogulonate reductase-like aldo/keto reductase
LPSTTDAATTNAATTKDPPMTNTNGGPAVALARGGIEMPLLGFGTWQATGGRAYDAVRVALETGYRHIDTATMYRNEREIGRALRDGGVPRDSVFLTTKLPPGNAGREDRTLAASLEGLGVDQVDLWLIHWPPNGQARPETWKAMLHARDEGRTRTVGVSNYRVRQIDELIRATGEAPAVNQIPWSPARYDPGVVKAHRERGVVLEGYSPLRDTDLSDPVLVEIAAAHGKTPAQVVLRWHVEHEIVVIPKSVTPARIRENFEILDFSLSPDEVARIDGLSRAR